MRRKPLQQLALRDAPEREKQWIARARLKYEVARRGWTLQTLASKCGLSYSYTKNLAVGICWSPIGRSKIEKVLEAPIWNFLQPTIPLITADSSTPGDQTTEALDRRKSKA